MADSVKNKPSRKELAAKIVKECKDGKYQTPSGLVVDFSSDLAKAVAKTEVMSISDVAPEIKTSELKVAPTTYGLSKQTTMEAFVKLHTPTNHVAMLIFASATSPGGGMLNGSVSQEESNCYDSALYHILSSSAATSFYKKNTSSANKMYENQLIWSPNVPIHRQTVGTTNTTMEKYLLGSFITCAAVNNRLKLKGAVKTWAALCEKTMKLRIRGVLECAARNHVDTLILGAFGCGVFENDPKMIARLFREVLLEPSFTFKHVEFALRDSSPGQECFTAFEKELAPLKGLRPLNPVSRG